jgi:hypothetical protein
VKQALELVALWLAQPTAAIMAPGPRHFELLFDLLTNTGTGGNLTSDVHLAAIARAVLSAKPSPRATWRAEALSHACPTTAFSKKLAKGALLGNSSTFSPVRSIEPDLAHGCWASDSFTHRGIQNNHRARPSVIRLSRNFRRGLPGHDVIRRIKRGVHPSPPGAPITRG